MPKYVFTYDGQLLERECENKEQLLEWIKSLEAQKERIIAGAAAKTKLNQDLAPYSPQEKLK